MRALFRAWLPFGTTLLLAGRLPRREAELVILRTAWACNGWYEWTQHVDLAVRAGLTPAQVAGVPAWRAHADFTEGQRTLLQATDELLADRVVCDSTLAELRVHLDHRQVVELCVLVGHYEMLAMTLNTLRVTPDRGSMRCAPDEARDLAERLRGHLAEAQSERRELPHEENGDSPWNIRSGVFRS